MEWLAEVEVKKQNGETVLAANDNKGRGHCLKAVICLGDWDRLAAFTSQFL
jgi:hypothetical protein